MINKIAALPDYDDFAKKTLSKQFYEYIKLKLRGMANMSFFKGTETTILGHKVSSPIAISPLAMQQLVSYEGETATA